MRTFLKAFFSALFTLLIAVAALFVIYQYKPFNTGRYVSMARSALSGLIQLVPGEQSSSGVSASSAAPSASCWGDTGMQGITVYEYGRSLLTTDAQRSCYDQIAAAVRDMDASVKISTSLDPLTVESIYKYYFCDHAENFYLSRVSMSYTYTQLVTKKHYDSYTFAITYLYDKDTAAAMRSQLRQQVLALLAAADGKTGGEEKERALHDALVNAVQYDSAAVNNAQSHPESFTAYGALVNGKAVCDGYAKAMKLLLDQAGVRSIYVSGTAVSESGSAAHAWDMAQVNGKWYYLDPTFDDPVFYNSNGQQIDKSVVDHTYFNYTTDAGHTLGTFDTADPFSDSCENYPVMPPAG